jgi:hypothetical protein
LTAFDWPARTSGRVGVMAGAVAVPLGLVGVAQLMERERADRASP